jgi:hypothetical protein
MFLEADLTRTPLARTFGFVVLWSVFLAVALGAAVATIEARYLDANPYFYDAAYYSFENARLHEWARIDGRGIVLLSQLKTNGRDPLRTLPLLLLAPDLLAHPLGHLATALPPLAAFLAVLGWTLLRLGRSPGEMLLGTLAFATLPGFFDPRYGLGAYWLDLPAAMLLGAAVLSLTNAVGRHEAVWLTLAGLFGATAALSRYVAAAFVLNTCAPLLAWRVARGWRQDRSLAALLRRLALTAGTFLVLAGPYLALHARTNAGWYAGQGYGLFGAIGVALRSVTTRLGGFFATPVLIVLGLLLLLNVAALGRPGLGRLPPALWAAVSHPVLLVLVLRDVGHPLSHVYAVPMVFALAVAPGRRVGRWALAVRRATCGGLIVIAGLGAASGLGWLRTSRAPSEEKAFDQALARSLVALGDRPVWSGFFGQHAHAVSLEAFYASRRLPLPADLFPPHELQWAARYPGLGPEDVGRSVFQTAARCVDALVVFAIPRAAEFGSRNAFNREVARFASESIRTDSAWQRVENLKGTPFGRLALYRNLHASEACGERLLRGLPLE